MPADGRPYSIAQGDCRGWLKSLPAGFVAAVVTSPPYWGGLRDYGNESQLGLERDPAGYVDALSDLFIEVRRVLKPTGSLWLNIGDAYAASGKGGGGSAGGRACWGTVAERKGFRMPPAGYKMKDLTLVPFQVADRLRRDGWYLRATVVWRKPAAVEPMRADRPAVSHEYLFQFAAAEQYRAANPGEAWWGHSVWDITQDRDGLHPAAMPLELARRCIVASTAAGDIVADPFAGSGTTGHAALLNGRRFVGCELNEGYADHARRRLAHAWGEPVTDAVGTVVSTNLFAGLTGD
jgi:site-specific DNA-methyltransferase (cytosine-N4-specific)